jgi:hypothetical protein
VPSIYGGHKTVRLAKKKGGSSNFIALLPVSHRNKAIKLSGARHLFILRRRLLNAIRPVLAKRHRSHYFSGFTT